MDQQGPGYVCSFCQEELPENMFAHRGTPGGALRRDGWCLDCRGSSHARNTPTGTGTGAVGDREYRNAHYRAVATTNRQLRAAHPQAYKRYLADAQERNPLPPIIRGDAASRKLRAQLKARYARRAAQRLRTDYSEQYEQLLEAALREEGYELRRPRR